MLSKIKEKFRSVMDILMPWEEVDHDASEKSSIKRPEPKIKSQDELISVHERAVHAASTTANKKPRELELPEELVEELMKPREDFKAMLFRLVNRSGKTNPEIYHAAQIDRKLFSAIFTKPHYQPSRTTVIRLTLALELSLPEAMELMERAGYAFSASRPADLIVTYYISRGIYDLMVIEEALYEAGERV